MLILLTAWLVAGLAAALWLRLGATAYETGLVLDVWAMGFLALVVIQFVTTIRGALGPKPGAERIHTGPKP